MALDAGINYINYTDPLVGENHPLALTDTLNRALKEFSAKFDEGNADTQVMRNHIKIASATDIAVGVVSDDIVWFNPATSKYEKATDSSAVGIIDVENLMVLIFGMYQFKTLNTLVIGTKYYLSSTVAGAITDLDISGVLIGTAFGTNTILNVTTGGGAGGSGFPPVDVSSAFNEIANDGTEGFWSPVRMNPIGISEDLTIPTGANAQVAGPFALNDCTLTISDGSVFVVN